MQRPIVPLSLILIAVATQGCLWHHHHRQKLAYRPHILHHHRYQQGPPVYNLPPAPLLLHPGPGVDGPGPGVMMPGPQPPVAAKTTQVAFVSPKGMQVQWSVTRPGAFDSEPLVCPGAQEFPQGAIYRLKLTNIPGHPGKELYPTIEVGPATPQTEAFLAHNQVPVAFTQEDFAQVFSGNFVTKVIYLPDPEYQELAVAGVETLVSTRLEPGVDPIREADRRGSILVIIRMGNKDLQLTGAGAAGGNIRPASFQGGAAVPQHESRQLSLPPAHVSGVTMPPYGMPYVGTPIGLPGPPHLPLGVPAGLQRHSITNHTKHRIPGPTKKLEVHVRQVPGFSYPQPPTRTFIEEQVVAPGAVPLLRGRVGVPGVPGASAPGYTAPPTTSSNSDSSSQP